MNAPKAYRYLTNNNVKKQSRYQVYLNIPTVILGSCSSSVRKLQWPENCCPCRKAPLRVFYEVILSTSAEFDKFRVDAHFCKLRDNTGRSVVPTDVLSYVLSFEYV